MLFDAKMIVVHLGEEVKGGPLLLGEGLDLLIGARLLSSELVAGEGEDAKTATTVRRVP